MNTVEGLKEAAKFTLLQHEKKVLKGESLIAGIIVLLMGIFYSPGHPVSWLLVITGVLMGLNGLQFVKDSIQLRSILTRHISFHFLNCGIMVISLIYKVLPIAANTGKAGIPSAFIVLGITSLGFAAARMSGIVKTLEKDVTPDEDSLGRLNMLIDHMKTVKPGTDPEMIKMENTGKGGINVYARPVENHVMVWTDNYETLEFVPISQFTLEPYYGPEREVKPGILSKGSQRVYVHMRLSGEQEYMGYLTQEDMDRFNNLLQDLSEWSGGSKS